MGFQTYLCILVGLLLVSANDLYVPSVAPKAAENASVDVVESILPPLPKFIPTKEWQEILPGQSIPPGLHIRIDFESGTKWAKILEEENPQPTRQQRKLKKISKQDATPAAESSVEEETVDLTVAVDDKGVLMLPEPPPHDPELEARIAEAQERMRRREVQSLEHMAHLLGFQNVEDDAHVMQDMLSVITRQDPLPSAPEATNCMEVIEDVVHKYDSAVDLVTLGGMDVMLRVLQTFIEALHRESPTLIVPPSAAAAAASLSTPSSAASSATPTDSATTTTTTTSMEALLSGVDVSYDWWKPNHLSLTELAQMTASAAWVIGTAAQNNPKVQAAIVERQGLHRMLSLLSWDAHTLTDLLINKFPFVPVDILLQMQARVLYALASTIRSNRDAQTAFYQLGGVSVLQDLLSPSAVFASPMALKRVQRKAVNLIMDLLTDGVINSRLPEDIPASAAATSEEEVAMRAIIEKHSPTIHPSSPELLVALVEHPTACVELARLSAHTADIVVRDDALRSLQLLIRAHNLVVADNDHSRLPLSSQASYPSSTASSSCLVRKLAGASEVRNDLFQALKALIVTGSSGDLHQNELAEISQFIVSQLS